MSAAGMPGTLYPTFWRSGPMVAAALALALLAAGCSIGGGFGAPSAAPSDPSSGSSGVTDRISSFFSSSSAKGPQTVANAQPDVNCPPVEVRQGASTLSIGPTGENTAMSLKYQGDLTRLARECAVVGGSLAMRIGVQGRVIVGPAGGLGQVDVPLRIAVVQETPGGMRPIATKFIRIPVTVTAAAGGVVFSHIEEGLSFPVPTPISLLDDYIAYVGFDPLSGEAQDKQKPAPKRQGKPAASAN